MQVNFVRALAPEKETDKPPLLTDFAPCVCAGFTLSGYKVEGGYEMEGKIFSELPEYVELNDMIYSLEEVKVEDNGFFNAEYV